MQTYSCVLVDDDDLARISLEFYVKKSGLFNILGVFPLAGEALSFIKTHQPDVLFLDIDMPGLSGMELREKVKEVPVCVFISSHGEYALETFSLDTLDFLEKPLKWDRFQRTIERIDTFMNLKEKANLFDSHLGGKQLFIKEGTEEIKINIHDIMYIEALKNYTRIVTSGNQYSILSGFGSLLEDSQFKSFIRIHKSFAVQQIFVQKITSNEVLLHNGSRLPVGRKFKDNLDLLK